MITNSVQNLPASLLRSRPSAVTAAIILMLSLLCPLPMFAHKKHTHQTIVDYAAQKAASLPTPVSFSLSQRNLLQQGAYDEDDLVLLRPRNHAFNPITDRGFVGNNWSGTTARNESVDRWNSVVNAFLNGNFDGGDGVGAWHFLGRVSHLLQDMTSPLHTMAIWHDGVVNPVCQFETYWGNNDSLLRSILSSAGNPLHSRTLDAKATERLDSFTAQRLQHRFNNSSPNKNTDDVRGWIEVLAWISYFRGTFWGQVTMGSSSGNGSATATTTTSTTFSDGTVGSQANVLHTMFGSGNVRWINSFTDNYYETTDRNSYVFRWMSWTDIDDWSSCGRFWSNGQIDTSTRVGGGDDDSPGVGVTGRFWFDLRELGRSTSGNFNRYCFPRFYPNGNAMSEHLHQFLGNYLDPLAMRYNAGLLGLANRRVTVRTADSTAANSFSWGRRDNFGNGPSFNAGSGGAPFYFVAKSSLSLTAPASNTAGRSFVRWLKNGSTFSGNTRRMITINTTSDWIPEGGVTYMAEYQADYTLSTGVSPSGSGSISASPPPDGDGKYAAGTVVTLTANAASGYQFNSWSGDASGSDNPTQVTMNGNRSVTVNFTQQPNRYILLTSVMPSGGGSISASPPPDSDGKYGAGTVVTLTANAASGYQFSSWSGDASGSTNPTEVTMNGNRSVTATFTLQPGTRTLAVASSNPDCGVSVNVSPNDNSGDGTGSTAFTRTYNNSTVVTLTAPQTANGNNFQKWQRNGVDWATTVQTTVIMDADYTMAAVYQAPGSLRAYYPFTGNPNDKSGNGNHGTVNDAVLVGDRFGIGNSAYQFNGVNSHIAIPDSPSLALNGAATFAAWAVLDGARGPYILKKGVWSQNAAFQLAGYTDFIEASVTLQNGQMIHCRTTDAALSASAWTHIAGMFDGQTLALYVNGVLRQSAAAQGSIQGNAHPLYIGGDYGSTGGYFNGRIDEVRIYNVALSSSEIRKLYAETGPILAASGHYYEYIDTAMTWTAARDAAASMTYNGRPGHLATITSESENSFVAALVPVGGAWLGGFQPPGTSPPDANWQWVTGEPFTYSNWAPGEPNDFQGTEEDALGMYGPDSANHGRWNDDSNNSLAGFVVEYEGTPPTLLQLRHEPTGELMLLIWEGGVTLQEATTLTGSLDGWSDVIGATSPYPVTISSGTRYYRLKRVGD